MQYYETRWSIVLILLSASYLPVLLSQTALKSPAISCSNQFENVRLIRPIVRSFRKLSPRYVPETISIVIPGDDLQMTALSPANANLLRFLQQYPKIAQFAVGRRIKPGNGRLATWMTSMLDYDYSKFLQSHGTRLACISYLLGVTDDFKVVENIARHSEYLESVFGGRLPSDDAGVFKPTRGLEIVRRLLQSNKFGNENQLGFQEEAKASQKECLDFVTFVDENKIFVRFPSVSELATRLTVPGTAGDINTDQVNVTGILEGYHRETLACLETWESKVAFSKKLLEFVSETLVPETLRSRKCVSGFHRLLNFVRVLDWQIRSRLRNKASGGKPVSVIFAEPAAPYIQIHGPEKPKGVLMHYTGFLIFVLLLLLLLLVFCVLCWKETIYDKCQQGYRWIYAYWVKKKWKKPRCLSGCYDDKSLLTSSSSCSSEQSLGGRSFCKDTSRDIYIQLTERPCEITATETECELNEECCDEFSIFKNARPGKPQKHLDSRRIVRNPYSGSQAKGECANLLQTDSEDTSSDDY